MVAHRGRFVAYYRVSTDGRVSPGSAWMRQQTAVQTRLNGGPWGLVGEFTEVESGKRAKRPQLVAALACCKKHKAQLIVAKLDRLTPGARASRCANGSSSANTSRSETR